MSGEQGHDPDELAPHDQRVSGEGHHPLTPGPRVVAHLGVVLDVVGQVGLPLLGDPADLELADGHPAVRAVQVRVQPLAGPQFQHPPGLVERPDAGEGRVEVSDQGPGTPAEHCRQFVALDDRLPDVGRERRQELPFGPLDLDLLAGRNVGEHDHSPFDLALPAQRRGGVVDRERGAVGAPEQVVFPADGHTVTDGGKDGAFLPRVVRPVRSRVVGEGVHVLPDRVLPTHPNHPRRRGVDEGAATVPVDPVDPFSGRLKELLVTVRQTGEFLLGQLAVGDVLVGYDRTGRPFPGETRDPADEPAPFVRGVARVLQLERVLVASKDRPDAGGELGRVLRVAGGGPVADLQVIRPDSHAGRADRAVRLRERLPGAVDGDDRSLLVQDRDTGGQCVHDVAREPFRLLQRLFDLFPPGDVTNVAGEERGAGVGDPGDGELDRELPPVRVQAGQLDPLPEDRSLAGSEVPVHAPSVSVAERGWHDELVHRPADRLGARVPERALGRRVPLDDPPVGVDDDDAVHGRTQYGPLQRLARPQLLPRVRLAKEVSDLPPGGLDRADHPPGRGRHPAAEELEHAQHVPTGQDGNKEPGPKALSGDDTRPVEVGFGGDLRTPERLAGRPHLSRQPLTPGEPPVQGRGRVIGRCNVGRAPDCGRLQRLAPRIEHPDAAELPVQRLPDRPQQLGRGLAERGGAGQHLTDRVLDGQSPVLLFPPRDVPEGDERPATAPLVENGGRDVLDRHGGAVLPPEHLVLTPLNFCRGAGAENRALPGCERGAVRAAVAHQLVEIATQYFFGSVAEHSRGRGVDERAPSRRVQAVHPVRRRVKERLLLPALPIGGGSARLRLTDL